MPSTLIYSRRTHNLVNLTTRSSKSPPSTATSIRLSSTTSLSPQTESPSPPANPRPWHALIRTHHITSLKKVAKLRHAASEHGVFAMLRSGGKGPGIMYVIGINSGRVAGWVGSVKKLRYKDYQLAVRPAPVELDAEALATLSADRVKALQDRTADISIGLEEIESVKDYSRWMEERGLLQWWRQGMGYTAKEERQRAGIASRQASTHDEQIWKDEVV